MCLRPGSDEPRLLPRLWRSQTWKRKSVATAIVGGAVAISGAGAAYAGTTYRAYNTTVGCCNGSGYTAYQTQATTGASARLRSATVGGSYTVDARVEGPVDGDWDRNVGDNDDRWLQNDNSAGRSVRVQFSNDWNTTVAVQVTGDWRSN